MSSSKGRVVDIPQSRGNSVPSDLSTFHLLGSPEAPSNLTMGTKLITLGPLGEFNSQPPQHVSIIDPSIHSLVSFNKLTLRAYMPHLC